MFITISFDKYILDDWSCINSFKKISRDCDVIINATSLGLKANDKLPFDVKKTLPNSIIADIIMQPEETDLLKKAKSLGRSIHYGKSMIESQIDLVGDFFKIW